jgi:hypothetical protein
MSFNFNFKKKISSDNKPKPAKEILSVHLTHPDFPIEVFPEKIQKMANELQEKNEFNIDFFLTALISIIGSQVGAKCMIQAKSGWKESTNTFTCMVGNSSIKKSPVYKFLMSPLDDLEEQESFRYKQEYDAYFDIMSDKEASKKGVRAPIRKDYYLDDMNMESVIKCLLNNKNGVLVFKDELKGWIKAMNQYRGGGGEDMEFWLKANSNGTHKKTRSNGESIFIKKVFISVTGGTQPSQLKSFAEKGNDSNGFIYRILWAYPKKHVKKPYNDLEISPELEKDYYEIIHNLQNDLLDNDGQPNVITWSPEAKACWVDWYDNNVAETNAVDDDNIQSLFGKLEGYVPRLALILQATHWACDYTEGMQHISEKAILGAIKLIEYYRITALKVQLLLNNMDNENDMRSLSKNKVNWNEIFKKNDVLKLSDIITLTIEKYGYSERSINRLVKSELFCIKHGFYKIRE